VGPDIALGVELGRLGDAAQADDLGEDFGEEAEVEEQLEAAAGTALGEDSGELVADALGADEGDLGGVAANGGGGGGVDLEVEARGEADGAQHSQLVFGEAQVGVADGADDAGGEVFAAVNEVERGGGGVSRCERVEEHSVDGEVAAEDVFAGIGGVTHGIRPSAVGVSAVRAEGGDLDHPSEPRPLAGGPGFCGDLLFVEVLADEDDAEVGADGEGLGEEGDDLLGGGGGGDVEVLGREAEQQVADAAAGEEGLVAGVAQAAGDGERGAIRRTRWTHFAPSLPYFSLKVHHSSWCGPWRWIILIASFQYRGLRYETLGPAHYSCSLHFYPVSKCPATAAGATRRGAAGRADQGPGP